MKKLLVTILAVMMIFSFAACANKDDDTQQTPADQTGDDTQQTPADQTGDDTTDDGNVGVDESKWEIVVVPKDATNPWFVRMDEGVKEYAAETGLNVYQRGTPEIDATLQSQLIADLIASDVDAICVVPVDPASLEPVLKQAREAGIVVIAHEGASLQNVDYDIEAFSNEAYGAFIMDNLAAAMGEEGIYTTMVGHVTNASHNEWADGAVARQQEAYPNMTLLEEDPRVESEDNGDVAYQKAKELLKKYPDLKGIVGTSSYDSPGVARAIEELGLTGKVFTAGTGLPAANAEILKSGAVNALTLWDPALAGKAMCAMAVKMLRGEEITDNLDLGVDGYGDMMFKEGSKTVLEGKGWIVINAENVDSFGF